MKASIDVVANDSADFTRQKRTAMCLAILFLLTFCFAQANLHFNGEPLTKENDISTRALRVEKLKLGRAVQSLLANQRYLLEEADQAMTEESLILSLVELFSKLSTQHRFVVQDLHIVALDEHDSQSAPDSTLQLTFDLLLLNAISAIHVFTEMQSLMRWRPVEVQHCALVREQAETKLHMSCVVHIHHWALK